MNLFRKKIIADFSDLPFIARTLNGRLELIRKQFNHELHSFSQISGISFTELSEDLETGCALDCALFGLQLTNSIGFSYRYLRGKNGLTFEKEIQKLNNPQTWEECQKYRNRYLDCQGDITMLENSFTSDLFIILNIPHHLPNTLSSFKQSASLIGIMSQEVTAAAFGDTKTEIKLRRLYK